MNAAVASPKRTGLLWEERFMWHWQMGAAGLMSAGGWVQPSTPNEDPEAKRRVKNLIDACGLSEQLTPIKARPATQAEICYFHTPDYVERVERESNGLGGLAGPFSPFAAGGYEIASLAVGGLIETVDHVLDGKVDNAYALLRPPGHHARANEGLGGCVFGNIVIAAHHARRIRGLGRVAIVDFDVHHGNGAQEAFYADPSVLTVSIHQRGWYTLKGEIAESGEGEGEGYNINIPLPSGSGDGAYAAAFARVIIPALRRFKPDLILVAAGYDGGAFDLTSGMIVTSEGFRNITQQLVDAAQEICNGRIILEHEGGYSPVATPFSVLSSIEVLSGLRSGVEDPHLALVKDSPDQLLLPHQDAVIQEAVEKFGL